MGRPKVFTGTNLLIFSIVVISFMEFVGVFSRADYWLSSELFFSGNYRVLVTSSFLHADFSHLFFNCLSIYVFGNLVEKRIGVLRTYLVFFLGSIISGLVWVSIMAAPSLGASDGAFALMAAAVLLVPTKRVTSTVPVLNRITSYRVIANFSTVIGVATLVHILFFISMATGSGIIGLLARAFSIFDPVMSIVSNITQLGSSSSNVARISHVVGFVSGSFLAYLTDREDAVSNLKIFSIYMVFFMVFFLSPISYLKLGGFLGMLGTTLYLTPDIKKKESEVKD